MRQEKIKIILIPKDPKRLMRKVFLNPCFRIKNKEGGK